jgi:peroxiredoxin
MSSKTKLKAGMQAPDFTVADANGREYSLGQLRGSKSAVLVFLRYAGCPICQLSLQQLKNAHAEFEARNAQVMAFVQSPAQTVLQSGDVSAFPFPIIPDPDERIYKLFGVGSGGLGALLAPRTLQRGIQATLKGHRQGKMEGNTWQLPGDFIVDPQGVLKLARMGRDMGDNLSPDKLLSYL